MAAKLDSLGIARVFRHPRTGELVVDTDSLRRPSRFSGFGFGGDRYDDDEDDDGWDDDDFDDGRLDEYDDEFEGDDFGDVEGDFDGDLEGDFDGDELGDELGDDIGDDFGAQGRRRRRRLRRKLGRLNRREARTKRKLRRSRRKHGIRRTKKVTWGMTAVSGTDTVDLAGAASVKIRLQHDFRATDITFTGSAPGAKVTSIFFGDRSVWSSSEGIDVTVFGSTSFLRGLLKGQSLKAGLDITVNGTLTGAGDFAVAIIGTKPVHRTC
jgi:hypothetical protein